MKLYDYPMAPNPRRVNMVLIEKKVEMPRVLIDLSRGEQFSENFRARNPFCEVPVLELDDGTCIREVPAICRYLEVEFPETPLYGRNSRELARVEMWDHFARNNGMLALAEAYRNSSPDLKDRALPGPHNYAQIPALAERGLERIRNFLADLDEHLAVNTFLAGDFFSIADITAFATCDVVHRVWKSISLEREHLNRWYNQIADRESARATMPG